MARKRDALVILNDQHKQALLSELQRLQKMPQAIADAKKVGIDTTQYEQGYNDALASVNQLLDTYFPGWRREAR